MGQYKDLDRKVIRLAKQVVKMCTRPAADIRPARLSLLHIVTAPDVPRDAVRPQEPLEHRSDRLVLSEGHAVPVVYAAYCDLGGVVGIARPARRN